MLNAIIEKNSIIRIIVFVVLSSVLLLNIAYTPAFAESTLIDSGTCGNNVYWAVYDQSFDRYKLVISGDGSMNDYWGTVPWDKYKELVTELVVEEGITKIGQSSFREFSSLQKVSFPESLIEIGDMSFRNCTALTSIEIPAKTSIPYGGGTFAGCSGLESISVDPRNEWFADLGCNAIFNMHSDGTISLTLGCKNTVIPDGVTFIGSSAFSGCTGLTEVVIPDSVTDIEGGAFSGCTGLTEIIIPDSVTEIGGMAFSGCTGLTSIAIPKDVSDIGDYNPFAGCSGLESISVDPSNERYADFGCNAIFYTDDDGTVSLLSGCKNTVIPDSVNTIKLGAFSGCTDLTEIIIPDSVTDIGPEAFSGCTGLKNISLPYGLTELGIGAFEDCSNLKSIVIPYGVSVINDDTFQRCTSITTVFIPDTIKKIYCGAFSDCDSLKYIVYYGETLRWDDITMQELSGGNGAVVISNSKRYDVRIINPEYDGTNGVPLVTVSHEGWHTVNDEPDSGILVVDKLTEGMDYLVEIDDGVSELGSKGKVSVSFIDKYADVGCFSTLFTVVSDHYYQKCEATDPTCTEMGNIKHWECLRCGKLFLDEDTEITPEEAFIPALGHDWDVENIVFTWSSDLTEADALITCKRDLSHMETLTATVTNNTISGSTTYTASVTLEGITYTDTKSNIRIAGKSRYLTSIAAADHLKEKKGIATFDSIIIASGSGFPDALSASYLAYRKDAPILLIHSSVMTMVADYINTNLAPGGTVFIVGGEGVVAPEVEQLINGNVKRLAGKDRYETNIKVLEEAGLEFNDSENVLVACGTNFADALSASAVGEPILLVGKELNAKQETFLKSFLPGEGEAGYQCYEFSIIGGTGAVPEKVEDQLKSLGSVERVYGSNRYQTSIAVAERFFEGNQDTVVIANGNNFPDGLSGGPVATSYGAPLILLVDKVNDHAVQYFKDKQSYRLIIMGGEGVISNETAEKVFGKTA